MPTNAFRGQRSLTSHTSARSLNSFTPERSSSVKDAAVPLRAECQSVQAADTRASGDSSLYCCEYVPLCLVLLLSWRNHASRPEDLSLAYIEPPLGCKCLGRRTACSIGGAVWCSFSRIQRTKGHDAVAGAPTDDYHLKVTALQYPAGNINIEGGTRALAMLLSYARRHFQNT